MAIGPYLVSQNTPGTMPPYLTKSLARPLLMHLYSMQYYESTFCLHKIGPVLSAIAKASTLEP